MGNMEITTSMIVKRAMIILGVIILLVMLRNCAIVRIVGPFKGRVVDAQTKAPLEGTVVLVWFHKEGASLGGDVASVADVFEALTDANGEFRITRKLVAPFRVFEAWSTTGFKISIFKPGYGAYPRHLKAFRSPELKRFWEISEKEHNTYFLPKLLTIEERRKNRMDIEMPFVGNDKMLNLRKLIDEERVNVGLDKKKGKL